MHRRLTKIVLGAACALAPMVAVCASQAQTPATISPAQDIILSIGRGELINVPGTMADIFVANESIADVQVKSQRQLYVFGLAGGETTIYASNAGGDIIWSANVRVGSNIDSIDQMLSLAMPEAKINVATMGSSTVLLTGTVAAPEDAAEAERLVKAFVGEEANVVSRLRMATPVQVNLRVRFAEVNRSLVRALGTNLTTIDSTDGFQFGVGQGRPGFARTFVPGQSVGVGTQVVDRVLNPITGRVEEITATAINPIGSSGTTLAGVGRFLGLDIAGALDLAEREGLVTTLAQPNLTALSGETAEFLAGGEFPIPMVQGLGAVGVQFRPFGVSLAYAPTVLANGRISIRVRPEVSELTNQGAVTINGFQIPALTIRRAETTVELGSGESFMIAGLMSSNASNTIDKTPGAGDLPILGNLFRSSEFRRGETELVIVVTPFLVKPVNDRDIRLPTDGFATPHALEQLLLNRDTAGKPGEVRPMPRAAEPGEGDPALLPTGNDRAAPAGEERQIPARRAEAPAPGFELK